MRAGKHENYELLNLIGYGLAKFDMRLVRELGFRTKAAFFERVVQLGIAGTIGTVKNRQDLFDPFFDSGRRGWWQKGRAYVHRKDLIDSLFGHLDCAEFATVVGAHLHGGPEHSIPMTGLSPLMASRYKQLQVTGREAETYFMAHFQEIESFARGKLEDARLFGDGYDFQIQIDDLYLLAEVKGIRGHSGAVRLTEGEFRKASEFAERYLLVVVCDLTGNPRMTAVPNPTECLRLTKRVQRQTQITYQTDALSW